MASDVKDTTRYYGKGFPSPIAPDNVKKTPEYGYRVASAIYNSPAYGYNSYFTARNAMFEENTLFADGKQPMQTYLDLMGVDGNESFMNINLHPRPIAPKFRDILVNDMMNRIEAVECTGLSLELNKRKQQKKDDASFRRDHAPFIQELQQQSGVQFEDPNAFVPDSDEDLDLWSTLNDKEREEELMEEGVSFVMYNNDWDAIKREVCTALVTNGIGCSRTYFDGRNRIRQKHIGEKSLLYGPSSTKNFKNVPYIGHVEKMSIADARSMFPDYPEKELWALAYANRAGLEPGISFGDWNNVWTTQINRPYDAIVVNILFYEYRVIKYINYVKGNDRNNNPIFDIKKGVPAPTSPDRKAYQSNIPTIYQGAWIVGSRIPAMWGEMKNLIRNNEDVEDVKFSYSVYILNSLNDMMPESPIKAMKSSIINMDLAILRMQHTVAATPPPGYNFDLDAVLDIDLGEGIGKVTFAKLREIVMQTGDTFYRSKGLSGDQQGNRNPVTPNQNSFGDRLTQLMAVYEFEQNKLREYIGINEVRDGSAVNPRIGLQVMQNQVAASNTATSHIYDGFISIMTDSAKSIAIMLWDTLKSAGSNSMYIKLLGQKNADFIKERTNITSSNYLTKVNINMSQQDAQWLEQTLETAVAQKSIQYEDALVVRKYAQTNIDLAIRYLSWVQKKRLKEATENQLAQQKEMQENNAALAQQAQQQKAQEQQQTDAMELQKLQAKMEIQRIADRDKLIADCMVASMNPANKEIPEYVMGLVHEVITEKQEQEQAAAEQQAAMQQQAMAQQEMQGEPQQQVA